MSGPRTGYPFYKIELLAAQHVVKHQEEGHEAHREVGHRKGGRGYDERSEVAAGNVNRAEPRDNDGDDEGGDELDHGE